MKIFLFLCISFFSFGQEALIKEFGSKVKTQSSTQVYLQISKGMYDPGEEIWFKAYVIDAQSFIPVMADTTLYVQLLKAGDKSVVMEDRILIHGGIAAGNFILSPSISSGEYILAAYTTHSFRNDSLPFKSFRNIYIRDTGKNSLSQSNKLGTGLKLNFFPEGGHLVANLSNSVAFKAVDSMGNPVTVSGVLYEGTDSLLAFSSEHLGMGKFDFVPKQHGTYTATVSGKEFDLPLIQEEGITMKLVTQSKSHTTFLLLKSANFSVGRVIVLGQSRGFIYAAYSGAFVNDSLVFRLPSNKFPYGISEITVISDKEVPLTERLVFMNHDQDLKFSVKLNADTVKIKEKVILDITASDSEGNPVVAHLGLSIYDSFYEHKYGNTNILSHNHLSEQINGEIVNPHYYFNRSNEDRRSALDLLLLTQGWRRYRWGLETIKDLKGISETLPNIQTGYLKVRKNMPKSMIVVDYDGKGDLTDPIVIDENGQFSLSQRNLTQGEVYLKLLSKEDNFSRHTINLDKPFLELSAIKSNKIFLENLYFEKESKPVPISKFYGSKLLEEVTIKGKGKDYKDRYMAKLDSMAKSNVNGDYVCSYGILNCQNHPYGSKPIEGQTYSVVNGNSRSTMVYRTVQYTDKDLMDKFGLYKLKGYQRYREFYQPDYETNPLEKNIADLRSTLIWNPEIITDEDGTARVEFFSSDITGKFKGVFEGIASSGNMGVTNFNFIIKEGSK